jgi:hypothetical protein
MLVLVAINRSAYDDGHVTSVALIVGGAVPHAGDCDECYQPKLYYLVAGGLAHALKIATDNMDMLRLAGQIVAACAGLLTIWTGWQMLAEAGFSPRVRLLAWTLFVCNATLIAMFVQTTNDAFAIAFGSLAVVLTLRLVRTPPAQPLDQRVVFLIALACIGVSLSKGTGVVLSAGVALLLIWRAVSGGRRGTGRSNALALAVFAVPYLLTVPLLGQYVLNTKLTGSPFGISVAPAEPPGLFTPRYPHGDTVFERAGILSIADGYFTLKPFDLLPRPWHGSAAQDLTTARTSLWTQVFARSHFVFFEQWPLQWYDTDPLVVYEGRAIFIAGWITTGIMLFGVAFALNDIFGRRRGGAAWPALWSESGAAIVLMGALVMALVTFTYEYRHEGTMKPLYLYPAILCAVWAFARGATGLRKLVQRWRGDARTFDRFLATSVIVVCALYVGQLATLIQSIESKW